MDGLPIYKTVYNTCKYDIVICVVRFVQHLYMHMTYCTSLARFSPTSFSSIIAAGIRDCKIGSSYTRWKAACEPKEGNEWYQQRSGHRLTCVYCPDKAKWKVIMYLLHDHSLQRIWNTYSSSFTKSILATKGANMHHKNKCCFSNEKN